MCDSVRSEYLPRMDEETVSSSAGKVAHFKFMKVS